MATAMVGVSDHAGWAVMVTVSRDGAVLDRRRAVLVDDGVPVMPHHHDAQGLPAAEGVQLVELVTASARRNARARLDELEAAIDARVTAIALRACPALPPTIEERIANYRAMCVADWVMYREAIAEAARAKRWAVSWFDAKTVFDEATRVLKRDVAKLARDAGKALGPPWQLDHRMAMAAAIAAR
jgi:hypothetical protein